MNKSKMILERRQIMFDDGFKYLLDEGKHQGINEEIILMHLHDWKNRKPMEIKGRNGLFYKMIEHAKNRTYMSNTVDGKNKQDPNNKLGYLNEILFEFDPKLVLDRYNKFDEPWKRLLDTIKVERQLDNVNQEKGHWVSFSQSIISIANYLSRFNTINDFEKFVEFFNKNDDTRIALALLLKYEISGYGFALACDFLKESCNPQYVKPDTHIKNLFKNQDIAKELNLSIGDKSKYENKKEDIEVFRAVMEYSRSIDKLPYEVDKLFWLVGSGNFYLKDIRVKTSMDAFIIRVKEKFTLKHGTC